MKDSSIDLLVIGGGAAGSSAALAASRAGINVMLVEEMGFLGGTATSTYVTPMMKSMLSDGSILGGTLYREVLARMEHQGYAATNFDGNPGWFSPEWMKFILDDMMEEAGVKVLFHASFFESKVADGQIQSIKVLTRGGMKQLSAKFYIDATTDASVAAASGVACELGQDGIHQALSHRFIMAGVEIEKFATWLQHIDPDRNVSPVHRTDKGDILLTTAYTSEDKPWALRGIFMDAIVNKVLKVQDAEYFQIFTIPGQKGAVSFNCPRIYSKKPLSPLNPIDISYAQMMGRKQIRRLAAFCKKYFPGFEGAYISNVAPNIGVRDSRRIKGKYTLTADDILSARKFDNAVAQCNYPIDVHAATKEMEGGLKYLGENDYYEIPLECLEVNEVDNLLVVGRTISAEFAAQASLRVQPTCWSMGESAGKVVASFLQTS
jgi:hypothetical protein